MERNSFFARCEIEMIHWSTGKVFRSVSTSYACQLNFLGSIQGFILRWTPPKLLDGSSWNFVGWYIEALGMFSHRSQLPMRANSTSWEPTQLPGKHTRIYPSLGPIEWKEIPSLLDVKNKWYIEALRRFSDRSQLPMRAYSTFWETYKDLSFGELLLNYWKDRHEVM